MIKSVNRKVVAFTLSLALTLAPTVGFADTSVKAHWADGVVKSWESDGLIKGVSVDKKSYDESLTRGEFVSYLNSIFNFAPATVNKFTDLKKDHKYYNAIINANAAGAVSGVGNQFLANDSLTRQEAAVIIANAFEMKGSIESATAFKDYKKIASWALPQVGALTKAKYVAGFNGNFDPQKKLTRAEAIQMMDSVKGTLKAKAGTYSDKNVKNLTINTPNVVLKNMTIAGDLFITQGVGNGDVTLDNVIVNGRVVAKGGGMNTLGVINSTVKGDFVVSKQDGQIRVLATGTTDISNMVLNSGAKLEEQNVTGKGFSSVEVGAGAEQSKVTLAGSFETLNTTAPKLDLTLTSGSIDTLNLKSATTFTMEAGTVKTLSTSQYAAGTKVNVAAGATVTTLNAATPMNVTGAGKIVTATVTAQNTVLDIKPETLTVAPGVSTTVAGKVTTPTPVPTPVNPAPVTPVTPGGGGGGGGGGGTPSVPTVTSKLKTATVTKTGTAVTATVTATSATFDMSACAATDTISAFQFTADGTTLTVTSVTGASGFNMSMNQSISSLNSVTMSSLLGSSSSVSLASLRKNFGNTLTINGTLGGTGFTNTNVSLVITLGTAGASIDNAYVEIVSSSNNTYTVKILNRDAKLDEIGIPALFQNAFGQLPSEVKIGNNAYIAVSAANYGTIASQLQGVTGEPWSTVTLEFLAGKTFKVKKAGSPTEYTITFANLLG